MDEIITGNDVAALRREISSLRELLAPRFGDDTPHRIRVHVERSSGERKPYLLVFKWRESEKRLRLSATRTAIILTLLLDLEQRTRGLPGVSHPRDLALEVLQLIAPDTNDSARASEQIRVGFYRLAQFWEAELAEFFPARYDALEERLFPSASGETCSVEIIAADPDIEDALPKLGRPAMLDRLRRDRFLFVPGGGSGSERFLREIYGAPGDLNVRIAYARPQLITLPPRLVERYSAVKESVARHAHMHERLREKSLTFDEIVPEESLTLPFYPGMSREDQLEHLDHLEKLVTARGGYRLILTRGEIPFYIGTYCAETHCIAVFFRLPSAGDGSSFSSFAVWGKDVSQMAEGSVFEWLLNHPSTTVDPAAVSARIENARRILTCGPGSEEHA